MSVFWLRMAAGLYAAGLLHALLVVLRRRSTFFRGALSAFRLATVLHSVAIVELTWESGHFPVINFYESISLCGLLIALSFLFVYWKYQFASLAVCVFPLVSLMTQIGAMEFPVASWSNPRVRDAWLLIHVASVLFGYAALLLTALGSLFYLIQERRLKNKRPGSFFDRLPPLASLDNLITNSMSLGFVFITIGVITGSAWAFIESGTSWIGDPKIGISFLTWGFYLAMVFLRASAGWRGRKAAVMAIVVLGCSALTWAAHVGLRTILER